jgi:integrase
MSLKLYKRPNGRFHIRGTVQGVTYDQSARTCVRAEAEAIKAQLEADAFKRAVYGERAVATFADAAAQYMAAGGSNDHMTPLILRLGELKLSAIKQALVDTTAQEMKPEAKASTRVRQIYTPISAVMNFAAEQGLCDPIRLRKPQVESGRIEFLTPEEVELWIEALAGWPRLQSLFTFYVGEGCRATEALDLVHKDRSPKDERVVFWDTKMGYARHVQLQERVRAVMPARGEPEDAVFLNDRDATPWHAYDALNLRWDQVHEHREAKIKAGRKVKPLRPIHNHLLRHTWATWAYACTRDLTFLMQHGGWKSAAMVARYAHAASPDLAREVLGHGWEFFGREVVQIPKRRAKSKSKAS